MKAVELFPPEKVIGETSGCKAMLFQDMELLLYVNAVDWVVGLFELCIGNT